MMMTGHDETLFRKQGGFSMLDRPTELYRTRGDGLLCLGLSGSGWPASPRIAMSLWTSRELYVCLLGFRLITGPQAVLV